MGRPRKTPQKPVVAIADTPAEIYIIIEHATGEDPFFTPYLSQQSAKKHYEDTLKIYADLSKPFYPIQESESRDHFWYGSMDHPKFECQIKKEELYA